MREAQQTAGYYTLIKLPGEDDSGREIKQLSVKQAMRFYRYRFLRTLRVLRFLL
jgi:hypothetical protein